MSFLASTSPDFIADLIISLFSPEAVVILLFWVFVIVPSVIYSATSYKPTDCMGELSKGLMWLITGLLIFLSPLSLLLFYFYRYLYRLAKDRRRNVAAKKATQDNPPASPSRNPMQSHPSPVQITSPSVGAAYSICKFMWVRTIIFSQKLNPAATLESETYVWTAFFYAIAKHIRKQDIVDEIYTQFKESAKPFLSDHRNIDASLQQMQLHYRELRNRLNLSDIDPRTPEGIETLWELTAQYAFPNTVASDSLLGFTYNVKIVVNRALSLYNLSTPQETVCLMEANDGTLVRVPESKLESWEAAQSELRKDHTSKPTGFTPEQKEYIKQRILDDIYNPNTTQDVYKNESESCELTDAESWLVDQLVQRVYGPKKE